MERVFFINIKGGAGKTTLANELAWSLDRTGTPYSYYDLDEQGGSPHVDKKDAAAVIQIADTPSAPSADDLEAWAKAATVAVIPTRSGRLDLYAFRETLDTIRAANPDAKILIIQNQWNRWTTAREFGEWLEKTAPSIPVRQVPASEMMAQATALGKSIKERAPKAPATAATIDAVNAIREAAGLEREES